MKICKIRKNILQQLQYEHDKTLYKTIQNNTNNINQIPDTIQFLRPIHRHAAALFIHRHIDPLSVHQPNSCFTVPTSSLCFTIPNLPSASRTLLRHSDALSLHRPNASLPDIALVFHGAYTVLISTSRSMHRPSASRSIPRHIASWLTNELTN